MTTIIKRNKSALVAEGDTVVVYISFGNMITLTVQRGQTLAMKFGALRHEFMIGKRYGSRVQATKGYVYVLRPTSELWTKTLPHRTQVIYTPDIATIILQLQLRPGSIVCESGCGSGSMSYALCQTIQPNGRLYSYDIDASRVACVQEKLSSTFGADIACVRERNVCTSGFDVDNIADAVFLDVPNPWDAIVWAVRALNKQQLSRFASFSPCIEQVSRTCDTLRQHAFTQIRTIEVVPRTMKAIDVNTVNVLEPNVKATESKSDKCQSSGLQVYPLTQPTHTSYLTFATLLPMSV